MESKVRRKKEGKEEIRVQREVRFTLYQTLNTDKTAWSALKVPADLTRKIKVEAETRLEKNYIISFWRNNNDEAVNDEEENEEVKEEAKEQEETKKSKKAIGNLLRKKRR